MTSEQQAEAKRWIANLADHLECAAEIIRDDCPGCDEEDDADEREFVADARAFLASLAAPPAGVGAETAKGTTMKPADILIAAAERLERLGWCQGSYGGPAGPNCVRGAISRVVGDVEVGTQARWMLSRAIDTPVDRLTTWNDDPARTKEEVVAALRRAASALAGTGGRR